MSSNDEPSDEEEPVVVKTLKPRAEIIRVQIERAIAEELRLQQEISELKQRLPRLRLQLKRNAAQLKSLLLKQEQLKPSQ